jgi:hypothetical protein
MPGKSSGILFTNLLSGESGLRNQLLLGGSGIAAGDVDGDGWCDLFFCSLEGESRLYRNLGNWRFADITDQSGVRGHGQYSTGVALADVDGDRDMDLVITSIGGGARLFLNDGKGNFQLATNRGLTQKHGATTLALADVDGNGTLDLYVANNNSPPTLADEADTRFTLQVFEGKPVVIAVNGKPVAGTDQEGRYTVSPFDDAIREHGQPDDLYLNDGKGVFTAVSWTNGIFLDEAGGRLSGRPRDLGLAAMFRDMDSDGDPDIYICKDLFTPDRVWMNDGRGGFRAMSTTLLRSSSAFSMGVDFADIDRDGHDDFFIVDMLSRVHARRIVQEAGMVPVVIRAGEKDERIQFKRNTLQLNRGDGTYAEIAQLSGLDASEWSWTGVFLDVDLDGYEDVLISTGYDRDSMNADAIAEAQRQRSQRKLSGEELRQLGRVYPRLALANQAFHNLGNSRFEEKGHDWGFDRVGVKQGICCADLDNDGDLDVVTNDLNDEAGVYRNEGTKPRVAVKLNGLGANTRGIGSKIWLHGGAVPTQSQEMICGGRYLSCDDAIRVFAAGSETNLMRLEVRWRSGKKSVVANVRANRVYEIDEAGATGRWEELTASPKPVFEDVSALLKHTHHEDSYDDFGRQPLLPRKLSQLGPGLSWSDLDGDGREDLLVGSGRGGELEIFLRPGANQFQRLRLGGPLGRAGDDNTTVLGFGGGFLVGQAGYETGGTNGVKHYHLWAGGIQAGQVLGTGPSSAGALALGDMNGDGNLDLFVGGRVNAGRWPEAATSRIYHSESGKYVLGEAQSRMLDKIGMVSGAVWTDLNADGYSELILACEWGPLRIFHNDGGRLAATNFSVRFPRSETLNSQFLTLNQLTGWWNGVTTGDFDGDGRMDIVASNWGSNSKYERGRREGRPLRVYYGDWDEDGVLEVVEAHYDRELNKIVPWRGLNGVARGMPWVRARYATHGAYSVAAIEEILSERAKAARVLETTWLETSVFLNRGDHFEVVVLPGEAQFSPAFGVSVADMDGDGNEDVFLSQNFFGVDEETSRYDAGRAVWLRGDGTGWFEVVPGHVSGVKVYGEGRGSALCDYDGDCRVDLAVGQNGSETKLYHNVGAKAGLRVRLTGPAANPTGIGTVLRLRFGERWGPAREVHGGGGYWSQDSAVQVMATPRSPTAVWIRWPGGRIQEVQISEVDREITVKYDYKK